MSGGELFAKSDFASGTSSAYLKLKVPIELRDANRNAHRAQTLVECPENLPHLDRVTQDS